MNAIDRYNFIDSPFSNWEPRSKIITYVIVIFLLSFFTRIPILMISFLVSLVFFTKSNLPFSLIKDYLFSPFILLLPLLTLIIFFNQGKVLISFSFLKIYYRGLKMTALILLKYFSIMLITLSFLGTSSILETMKACEQLGLSSKFTHILLISYRYLFLYLEKMKRLLLAAKMRGLKTTKNFFNFQTKANIISTLFLGSIRQQEKVLFAMKLRGFSTTQKLSTPEKIARNDYLKSFAVSTIFLLLSFGQWLF